MEKVQSLYGEIGEVVECNRVDSKSIALLLAIKTHKQTKQKTKTLKLLPSDLAKLTTVLC